MSGVKGRSGGARPNTGGARPGAGRKPNPKMEPVPQGDMDMLEFLKRVALGRTEASPDQVRAAIAAVQYTHRKMGEGGKKDEKKDKAKAAAASFASIPPPRLVVNNVK